jgi:hypothetical protein
MVVMTAHRFALTILVSLCSLAASVLFAAPPALAEETCPNASMRTGFSANLPDCRAYELVSPSDKNGFEVDPGKPSQSAPNGESVEYLSEEGQFPGSVAGEVYNPYLSYRTPGGWVTRALSPPNASESIYNFISEPLGVDGFSIDLTEEVLRKLGEPLLAPGALEGYENLYVRNTLTDSYEAITTVKPPNHSPGQEYIDIAGGLQTDVSPTGNTVVFGAHDALTPGAPATGNNFYAWREGKLMLVSVLPDGAASPPCSATGGNGENSLPSVGTRRMISSDGLLVLWQNGVVEANGTCSTSGGIALYETDLATGKSVEISAPQGVTSTPGDGIIYNATSDGMKSYFTYSEPLTPDAGAGTDLYEYDLETHSLTDLTPAAVGEAKAMAVPYVSEDGSYVYFAAEGAIASTPNARGETPTAGKPNLYVWHDGSDAFIATLGNKVGHALGGDQEEFVYDELTGYRPFEGTPDGTRFLFESKLPLTGYDNTDAVTGEPDSELFLYDAVSDALTCVSCNPSGARPVGFAEIPYWYGSTVMSSDGSRVAFQSTDVLVPSDTDGADNVYEWEDGHVYLISTGRQAALLNSMSSTGGDIFFFTSEQLVPQDQDGGDENIYDARVGGGFSPPSSVPPCSEEGCRPPVSSAPSVFDVPASATFSGVGDLTVSPSTASQAKPKRAAVGKHKRRSKKRVEKRARRSKERGGRASSRVHGLRQRVSRRVRVRRTKR